MMGKRNAKGKLITNAISDKLHEIHAFLDTLEMEELYSCMSDLEGLTSTNCSWMIYRHKAHVQQMLAEVMNEKSNLRRMNRVKMGMEHEK